MKFNIFINAFDKFFWKIDPLLRLPVIFGIDYLIRSTVNFNSYWLIFGNVPAIILSIFLLLVVRQENYRFVYACGICLQLSIPALFFIVGRFVPSIQNDLDQMSSARIIIDAFKCYLTAVSLIEVYKMNLFSEPTLLGMFVTSVFMQPYILSWTFGYTCYLVGESLGAHIVIRLALFEATSLVKLVGFSNTFFYYCKQKQVMTILRLFWLFTVLHMLYYTERQIDLQWLLILVAASCDRKLLLLAMSLWLPEVSYFIVWITGVFLAWDITYTAYDLEPRDLTKAFVFFGIAVVNDVTNIKLPDRVFLLTILTFISFSYIFASVHLLTDEVLKSLATSVRSRAAHIRAIIVMLFLIWLLVYISYKFCVFFPQDFQVWQLAVVSSNIVTTVQALNSLAIYALFMYDVKVSTTSIDLDEWIYRITASSNICKFLSAAFVLGYAVWNVIKGIWNVVGLLIIVMHAYFNLWLQARKAWKSFMERRSALVKLNRLRDATREQLNELNDLCSICYQDMETAKITQCGHFFHTKCLRKWLYIQTSCPLCHQDVVMTKED